MTDAPLFIEDAPRLYIKPVTDIQVYSNELTIATDADNIHAGQQLTIIKGLQKQIKEHHKESVSLAHKAHKKVLEAQNTLLKPLETAEKAIKECIVEYDGKEQAKGVCMKRGLAITITDESQIPKEFMITKPNIKAIQVAMEAGAEIPGAEAVEVRTVSAKSV